MCCKKKDKIKRPPRQPRQGPYKKVNAYTTKCQLEQVLTLVIMIILTALHCIFVVIPLIALNNCILYVLLAINFVLLLIIIIDYVKITILDPVDSLILDSAKVQYEKKENKNELKNCNICRSIVYAKSYHCNRCNRCTQKFDHHCSFLGSCIGGKNYQIFIRILIFLIFYNIFILIQATWVFIQINRLGQSQTNSLTIWGIIPVIILAALVLIGSIVLFTFHVYISCCIDLTTIQFVQSSSTSSINNQRIQNQYKYEESPQNFQPKQKF